LFGGAALTLRGRLFLCGGACSGGPGRGGLRLGLLHLLSPGRAARNRPFLSRFRPVLHRRGCGGTRRGRAVQILADGFDEAVELLVRGQYGEIKALVLFAHVSVPLACSVLLRSLAPGRLFTVRRRVALYRLGALCRRVALGWRGALHGLLAL